MNRFFLSTVFLGCLITVLPCAAEEENTAITATETEKMSVLPLEDLRVFTKAYDHIRRAYIDEIDDRKLLEYAIRGMLEQLDPHSAFLDASEVDDLQVHTTGEFGGLGIEVGMEDGFVKVISPIDDTPAARGGIESGDVIIKIDDAPVKGLTLDESVEKMRGPKGSGVILTIVRKGTENPIEISLTRDIIKVRSVRSSLQSDRFAYIRIAQFQVNTGSDVADAIKKLTQNTETELEGVILDLRNNPGGVLQASVEVADLFLDSGLIVYTEGRLSESDTEYRATEGDIAAGLPIVVLINDGSASASEILAGALQDHQRALILGTRSFGKGSVQTVIPITDDRAVKITTALYFTPAGRSIQAQGIVPDINIERVKVTAVRAGGQVSEADLQGHLKNATDGKDITSQNREAPRVEMQSDDSQLYEALNILRAMNFHKVKKVDLEAHKNASTPQG